MRFIARSRNQEDGVLEIEMVLREAPANAIIRANQEGPSQTSLRRVALRYRATHLCCNDHGRPLLLANWVLRLERKQFHYRFSTYLLVNAMDGRSMP
jgi:anti-sigma regulatory factor (Ser/Thr protein kinase)